VSVHSMLSQGRWARGQNPTFASNIATEKILIYKLIGYRSTQIPR